MSTNIIEDINVNFIPGGVMPTCHVSQYDAGIRYIRVHMYAGNTLYEFNPGSSPNNFYIILKVRKPDGNIVTRNVTPNQFTPSNVSVITFATTEQMVAVAGKNICELSVQDSETDPTNVVASANFIMEVEKDPTYGGLTSASDIYNLEQQIRSITESEMGNYYTKAESDARYLTTADVYTKSQIDDVVNEINYNKADKSDVYTKDDVDGFLATKADSDDVYTKDEVDEIADSKLDTNEFTKEIFSKADKSSVYYVDDKLVLSHSANDAMIVVTDIGWEGSYVNVRTAPNTEAFVMGQLYEKECFIPEKIVTGESIDGNSNWAKLKIRVESSILTGYVACRYLRNRNMVEFNNPGVSNIPYKIINIDVLTKVCGISGISTSTPIYGWDKIKIYKNNSRPIEIELPETMWGGTIRISNLYSNGSPLGKARVIWTRNKAGCKLKDVSSWSYTDGIFVGMMDYAYFDSSEATTEILCGKYSSYTDGDISNAPDESIFNVDDIHVGIKDSSITSLDDFLSYINNQSSINNHTTWISYPDPVGDGGAFEIDSIVFYDGDNYIYTDCGNTVGCTVEINSDVKTKIEGLTEDLYNLNTLSDLVVSFNTSLKMPLESLEANITAQQESGTPSPSSPKPITGFSSVHINYVDFNQKAENKTTSQQNGGITWTGNGNGTITVSGTATATSQQNNQWASGTKYVVPNHVYFVCTGNSRIAVRSCYTLDTAPTATVNALTTTNIGIHKPSALITNIDHLYSTWFRYIIAKDSDFQTPETFTPQIFDLTQMFGATIADYIYSLEQANAGDGVAFVKNIFYKDYYAFNEGGNLVTLASVNNDNFPYAAINLGDTYYGGVLDVKNGTATITHIKKTFKWSEGGAVTNLGTYTRKMFTSSTMANESLVQLCNVAPYLYNYSSDSLHFYCRAYTDETRVYLFLDESNLPTGFDEFEVIYGLKTPITLTGLTPDNFTTVQGENTIFADSGDVSVSFFTKEEDGVIVGTLSSGSTSITLYNSLIKSDSTLDIYTNIYGVNPTGVTVTDGSITLTFEAQASDLGVKVVIK